MTKQTFKHALISIFIGACVAFVTTFLQSVLEWINAGEFNVSGIGASFVYYISKWRINPSV